MEMKENVHSGLKKVLENIGGNSIHDMFGEPFIAAFRTIHNGRSDEITSAAYTCSLFLSAIKAGFPTMKLHTFVHYIQDNCNRIHFDCTKYDTILALIGKEKMERVVLLDSCCGTIEVECSANDIIEALDFYTNR
jgi:hypothetical protein